MIFKLAVPVPIALTALRGEMKVPVTAGVPEMSPVEALRLSPVGNPVAL